ncbi:hypothetical protein [Salsipaludibacter albus]|uniref:hypothetical protein n=1 Tax=Salsipaludibacter albus TaxID=2849650 RepID=UPI001EE42CD2|nr:hypothetical protein [Salsipaludibacter albus]MBY5161306.1 hypothetical protein [Salsipaludibacter albus]
MGDSSESALALGRGAVDRGDWQTALDHLAHASVDVTDRPEVLRLQGVARYGAGDLEGAIGAFEDLHALHRDRGEAVDAARAAGTVAMYLMMDTGLMAPVRAWLTRADRLLADVQDQPDAARDGEGSVHALVAMVRTYERFLCGDRVAAGEWATRAVELGTAHDVAPAVALGRVAGARLSILDGEVEDGLADLDDVAAMLLTGRFDSLTTGMVWCELICAVRGLALHDRAEQWTAAMERWGRDAAFGGINGRCRVHRAELLRLRGSCDVAEREATLACEELRPWMRREFGWPLTELGTIRMRRGDLDGAQQAFEAAHAKAWDPQPGLALVCLARGDTATATAMVANALDQPANLPFKEQPPFGQLGRAPLLAAQVEIAATADDLATARTAAVELDRIADVFTSPALQASARLAAGRVALLDGDPDVAVRDLKHAVATWGEVGAPYEAAVARTVLGDAHDRAGNGPCARLEWRCARSEFARVGSGLWLDRVERRLDESASARSSDRATAHEPHRDVDGPVFRCDGDVRTITFDDDTVLVRDLKGMRYLAHLLAEPGREFHVLDLVTAEEGGDTAEVTTDDVDAVTRGGDAGPVLDDQARAAYRRRLAEIDRDIEEAEAMNDPERRALARADREYLVRELARATGIGGRSRRAKSTSERARSSVTRTLRYSIDRISEHHPALGDHLEQTIETGTYCAYRPDPRVPTSWVV